MTALIIAALLAGYATLVAVVAARTIVRARVLENLSRPLA